MVSLGSVYERLSRAVRLTDARASEMVRDALPHALSTLDSVSTRPPLLRVSGALVEASASIGGSLVPAWPIRNVDGSVTIQFVEDWGAMLATWRDALNEPASELERMDSLILSGDRIWVGVANDTMQLFVPDPPAEDYSMVRHHALMLVAATLWLGPDRAKEWLYAHDLAARDFLSRTTPERLWASVDGAERGIRSLMQDPRSRMDARRVLEWLDSDAAAAATYSEYLQATSLGIAALLDIVPKADWLAWLRHAVAKEHARSDFNVETIERYAAKHR